MRAHLFLLVVPCLAFACSKGEETEIECPAGTVREGSVCVRPDAGGDAGTEDDAGLPPKDGGPDDSGAPVDAGEDAASLSTTLLDFGGTVVGSTTSLAFSIDNHTSVDQVVSVGAITGPGEAALTLTNPPGTMTLAPGGSISVVVEYHPGAAAAHMAAIPVSLCEAGCSAMVQLTGTGLVEAIACAPSPVDFGFVNPNACVHQDVDCRNESAHPATIFDASLIAGSSPAFQVAGSTTTPVTLAGGDALTLGVDYCPTGLTNDSGTIAVTVDHPDPRHATKAIPLSGSGGGPDIQCTANVDFGITGVGQTAARTATCMNAGNVPLLVTAAAFAPGTTGELTATLTVGGGPATLPVTVAAGGTLSIVMTFAPAAPGMHTASFRIDSNDSDTPRVTIPVTAEALTANGCTIALSPTTLDFGAVAPGASAEAAATVRNTGTGACAVNVVGLAAGSAPELSLANGPQSLNLGPGQVFLLRIRFAPAAEGSFSGTVELTTTDVANAAPTIALTGTGLSPFGSIRAVPSEIDFGQVQAGCTNAAAQTLTLQNNGATPASVDVTLEAGTSPELGLTSTLPNPVAIAAGGTADFTVTFLPGAAGTFTGRVQIAVAGGPTIYVPLEGQGSAAAQTTVTFPGQATPELDVLVVVDDSCSMTEEQASLAAAGPILITRGDAAGAAYHIAVTTTDGTPGISGTLRGNPAVITWTSPTRTQDFQNNVNQGVNGSGIEEGLRTGTEAVTDSTLLAGPNAGFLRPNAELVLIIISDEDDQSPDLVSSYLDRLTTGRPTGAGGTPRIFTITGGLAGCVTADVAPRYVEAADQSGGFDRSVCLPSYTQIMTEIADATFAPARLRFPLGASAVPGSVVVRVNGVQVPVTDWGFDYLANEVVFLPGHAPRLTQTVAIDYATLCVPASCGDGTVSSGEQCDDGNPINTDACLDTCLDAFCGDGFLRASEQCDDGNTIAGDGCNAQCTVEGCGNGIVEPPEQCDNGNANSDTVPNACRTTCANASCGDAVTDTGEQCDDGNGITTDACIQCQTAFCGDGFVRMGVEECDDGNNVDTDACANDCTSNLINFVVTTVSAGARARTRHGAHRHRRDDRAGGDRLPVRLPRRSGHRRPGGRQRLRHVRGAPGVHGLLPQRRPPRHRRPQRAPRLVVGRSRSRPHGDARRLRAHGAHRRRPQPRPYDHVRERPAVRPERSPDRRRDRRDPPVRDHERHRGPLRADRGHRQQHRVERLGRLGVTGRNEGRGGLGLHTQLSPGRLAVQHDLPLHAAVTVVRLASMGERNSHLDRTVRDFLQSLVASSKHHTLCLNIADPTFSAEESAQEHLREMGKEVVVLEEPSSKAFEDLLAGLDDQVGLVHFEDLDESPGCIDVLLDHVKKESPRGKLVIVSRRWNSRNTEKEREIWKAHTLFFEQAPPAKEPKKKG